MFAQTLFRRLPQRSTRTQYGFLRADIAGALIIALLIGGFFAFAERTSECNRDAVSVHNTQRDCAGPLHINVRP